MSGAIKTLPRFFPTFDKDYLTTIYGHCWKERLKISNLAEFESIMSEASEDTVPQSREVLQTLIWWGAQTCPHHTNVYKILRLCGAVSLLVITLKLGNFTDFKALFPLVSMD